MDKKDAGAIKRKIILQMLIFTVCVLGVGLTLYMLCTSAGVAAFFRDTLSVDLTGFQSSVGSLLAPGSMGMVLFIVVLTLLLVFLLYLGFSSRVLRYLRGVGAGVDRMLGVDALLDGEALFGGGDHSDVGPRLPKEMFSVGKKLEMLQKSLSSREQAVRTAHQRKNRLVVNLAAEVRVPLANLTDCLAMVNDEPYMPYERKAECTAAAIEKAYELDELIDDFFELTRYNMGKTELSSKLVDLNQMFAQIIDLIRPLLVKQGKDVVVNAGEGSAVFGDPEKIARAFYGILKKALAFSNAKSVIYVEASVRDGRTNVDVTCYGETVSQEMLDALLENFYRAQEKPLLPGKTGLGLSVAHEIVLLHRGGMMAQSAEGKTVFTVSLPMAPAMGRGFEVSDVSEYVASMAKGLSISRSAQRNEGRKNKLALMSGGQGRTLGP
ncbi:MAG: HAMP domain-containing histidine kinase, partial [Gracilibacteraceae bacterium]|nr:HAMP domain-containing histidine kinase [Gracilibacteraceae bacterium]